MDKINNLEKQELARKNSVRIKNLIYKGIWETPPEIPFFLVLYTINQLDHRSNGSSVSYQVAKNG